MLRQCPWTLLFIIEEGLIRRSVCRVRLYLIIERLDLRRLFYGLCERLNGLSASFTSNVLLFYLGLYLNVERRADTLFTDLILYFLCSNVTNVNDLLRSNDLLLTDFLRSKFAFFLSVNGLLINFIDFARTLISMNLAINRRLSSN